MDFEKYKSMSRLSVAPMMDWTDRHCRFFHRLLSPNAKLYTEMVTTGAILYGNNNERFLGYNEQEHPIALQLGGSDPQDLAKACEIATQYHYDEINLNCGCPSDRVQNGRFGACLMKEPSHVAECFKAMQDAAPDVPVTIKCRIGVDNQDDESFLHEFIGIISDAGCGAFIVHARKALLKGLSPKENRDIPPLRYDVVENVKKAFPDLFIGLNGGLKSPQDIQDNANIFDGVMIGREAYQNPSQLIAYERALYNQDHDVDMEYVIDQMSAYIAAQRQKGIHPKSITRHMLGLFQNRRGAKQWRRYLSENAHLPDAPDDILKQALSYAGLDQDDLKLSA